MHHAIMQIDIPVDEATNPGCASSGIACASGPLIVPENETHITYIITYFPLWFGAIFLFLFFFFFYRQTDVPCLGAVGRTMPLACECSCDSSSIAPPSRHMPCLCGNSVVRGRG